MRFMLRKGLVILRPGDGDEAEWSDWIAAHAGQVFKLRGADRGAALHAMGNEAEACREPLNITSRSPGELRLISNFAHTPFVLDGMTYAGIEGFWQGLKFPDEADRQRLAGLYGSAARDAGYYAPRSEELHYGGKRVLIGTWDHWQLMKRACIAKFAQHDGARAALHATGKRPLVHHVKPDSRTIPGVIMAQIWMAIRARL
ncbi:hypothetical protein C7450_11184 [Chelatococcus asaccharovorans]|uniref:Uncharacterized protein n=2 Tax=Chelatococcus asaccharovorans TaxID=28210 RepID=A0A2V3TZ81_9HYPH|nr:hypothetical protein C7450_11184 [Chelatococcus asaccharovorans]